MFAEFRDVLRINVTIRGSDIPRWYRDWRHRGLVKSTSDAIVQAFRAFHEKLVELDLKQAQLDNLRNRKQESCRDPTDGA